MIIAIKIQGEGYLVNGNMHVPKAEGNKDYKEVLEAIAGGTEDYPTPIAVEPEFTDAELFEQSKNAKLQTILSDFEVAESQPVLYNGAEYNGGEESVTSIDKYVRLNRLAGATTHTIWDINNQDTILTDSQADELILAIGSAVSANKFALKNRKLALANATTIDEIEAV